MSSRAVFTATLWLTASVGPLALAGQWSHFAADPARSSLGVHGPRALAPPAWTALPESDERLVFRSSPVTSGGRVFVCARRIVDNVHVANLAIALDAHTGQRLWRTEIERDQLDSRSSPAIDERNDAVLYASGFTLYALAVDDGDVLWQTTLPKRVVNASPLVTSDLTVGGQPANRAFISDFTGAGAGGQLHAVNVDAFHAGHNPYQPGDVVWSRPLGSSSGATPAYANGRVYVGSYDAVFFPPDQFLYPGVLRAFDALSGELVWSRSVEGDDGFFGGVTLTSEHVYAATYDFQGTGNNSRLFKVRTADGHVVWTVACERSTACPVAAADGCIYLAAGIDGFGSASRVQAFKDLGGSAQPLWDTYADSGGSLLVGGWTYQPALARQRLYVGVPDTAPVLGPYEELRILDLRRTPSDPNFVLAAHEGSGGSPAINCGWLYSIGEAGVVAFETTGACLADLDGDGSVGQGDLGLLLSCYGTIQGGSPCDDLFDLNCDGSVNQSDLGILLAAWGKACP